MAFLMKTMISSQVKNLGLGGRSEEQKEEGGWKEMLHLHKKRQRGRASEFTSEKSTDSQ
eukprot:bmy_15391T0